MSDVPPLWKHQEAIIARAVPRRDFGILAEPGTGKTRTAIEILRRWYTVEKRILRTLIIAPPIVITNWAREIQRFSKVGAHVIPLEGPGLRRVKRVKQTLESGLAGPIFVTNYEGLLMPTLYAELEGWEPEVLILDESHRIKNFRARRTRLAIKLADTARYKLILTGTPLLNTPLDLFAQYRMLDGGKTFGKNLFVFRAEYFYDKNAAMPRDKYFPNWIPRPGSLERLNQAIASSSMVVKKSECLDLPPLVKETIYVELAKEQAKLYDAMKKDFIAYVNDRACVANLAITKLLRLQQIVSGFVTLEGDDGGRSNVRLKDNPRATALREILSDVAPHAKVIVWSVFRENYAAVRQVCEELALGLVEVHGDVSAKARQEAVDRFNLDPEVRVFSGHPMSAGIGVNLVVAPYAVFYSRTFSLEQYLQAEARNYRGGSEIHAKVTRIDLVARGTIDEAVLARLAQKMDVSEAVLRDLAKEL